MCPVDGVYRVYVQCVPVDGGYRVYSVSSGWRIQSVQCVQWMEYTECTYSVSQWMEDTECTVCPVDGGYRLCIVFVCTNTCTHPTSGAVHRTGISPPDDI